jgi:hypothetical protein
MHRPEELDSLQQRIEAFQVDRSWYERRWMQERPRRVRGILSRVLWACLATLRKAVPAERVASGQAVAAASNDTRGHEGRVAVNFASR